MLGFKVNSAYTTLPVIPLTTRLTMMMTPVITSRNQANDMLYNRYMPSLKKIRGGLICGHDISPIRALTTMFLTQPAGNIALNIIDI